MQRTGWILLLLSLAGLNVYQWTARPTAPDTPPAAAVPAPKPAPADDAPISMKELIDRFHKLFYANAGGWPYNKWLGVKTLQNPNDVWITQEILFDVKPDFVVETGTAEGGSAALWATVLEQFQPDARVITIDIQNYSAAARELPVVQRRVDFLVGSSTDPAIVAEVTRRVAGRKALVLLDSNHAKDHVLRELELYAPLVPVGSYMIVQDTNVNGHPVKPRFGPGPFEAVTEFLANDDRFEPDRTRERLLFTMHPRGYLKRVR